MIRFEHVAFSYRKGEPVFAGLDLEIGSGLTLVLGINGSGKSTLLKLASDVEHPDAGAVFVDGRDLWKDEIAARRGLAYLPEFPDLSPYATIREICDFVCRLRGEPVVRGREALDVFGLGPMPTARSASCRSGRSGERHSPLPGSEDRPTFSSTSLSRPWTGKFGKRPWTGSSALPNEARR